MLWSVSAWLPDSAVPSAVLPAAQGANDVSALTISSSLFSDAFERVRANYVRPVQGQTN